MFAAHNPSKYRRGPLYEVPEGMRNKARHNEPYYPPVEPARPVGDLKTA
nr:hypothetical protein [Escherichia coli]